MTRMRPFTTAGTISDRAVASARWPDSRYGLPFFVELSAVVQ